MREFETVVGLEVHVRAGELGDLLRAVVDPDQEGDGRLLVLLQQRDPQLQEVVAAVVEGQHHALLRQVFLHPRGHPLQCEIAEGIAVDIVDHFEVADVRVDR